MKNKTINLEGVTPQTWARTIWFFIGLISQLCIIFHLAPLPPQIADVSVETLTIHITNIMAIIGEIRAWWKNNSFSKSAQVGDVVMKDLETPLEYIEKANQPDTDHHYPGVG